MKKIIISLMLLIIVSLEYSVLAYSTKEYNINIPDGYNQVSSNSFTADNGDNINIQIVPYESESRDDLYSEKHLDELVEEIYTGIDKYRDEIKNKLREKNEKYGSGLTEEEIEEYANSVRVDSIEKKEIITFSRNYYKGFHIIYKMSIGDTSVYVSQYTVGSQKKIYTLTITCSNSEDLYSEDNKNVVDSFTIKDFKEVEGKSSQYSSNIISKVGIGLIIVIVFALTGKATINKKKSKEIRVNENEAVNIDSQNNIENNNKEEKRFCSNCGKEVDSAWEFCNYCGKKLK